MPDKSPQLIAAGTPEFRQTCLALFAGGLATFAALYCTQPLLPVFAAEFGLDAATSSLSVSASTGALAVALLGASFVSDRIGPKETMVLALLVSSLLTLALAFTSGWTELLILRGLAGLALSGFPAISIAYLSQRMNRAALGIAVGLTVSGNSIGGMGGRLIVSILSDLTSWRMALGAIGVFCLVCTLVLWLALPSSRHQKGDDGETTSGIDAFARHLREPGLLMLFAEGFCLMGAFVTLYNYVGFRLLAPPFSLSQTVVGFIFVLYAAGTISSSISGMIANRIGRRSALWLTILVMLIGVALVATNTLALIIIGIGVVTIGFFAAHSVASSWVGLRADGGKAQASSLYMLSYYMGSSVAGSIGGMFWSHGGWSGVTLFIGGLGLIALLISFVLARIPPPVWLRT